jgi:holo-[acyl-carrier protein] synthase
MHIIGHGIDAIDVERIRQSIASHGERFLERVFTSGERAYAAGSRRRDEHLAARFAAKEAVAKADAETMKKKLEEAGAKVTLK